MFPKLKGKIMKISLLMLILGTIVGVSGILLDSDHLNTISAIWIVGSIIKLDTERIKLK